MKIKQRLRLQSFAKFIGGQFSRSSADRATPFLTPRIWLRSFLRKRSKDVSFNRLTETEGDSDHFCVRRCSVSCTTKAINVMRRSAVATYVSFPGMIG